MITNVLPPFFMVHSVYTHTPVAVHCFMLTLFPLLCLNPLTTIYVSTVIVVVCEMKCLLVAGLQASAGTVNSCLTFQQLLSMLSTRLHSSVVKNLSVPIAFVCLLHLANDKVGVISLIACGLLVQTL